MDGSFLLGSVVLAIAAVVLFIVFYSLRLLKASRDAKEAAERFQVMMHKQGELRENFALMGESREYQKEARPSQVPRAGRPEALQVPPKCMSARWDWPGSQRNQSSCTGTKLSLIH